MFSLNYVVDYSIALTDIFKGFKSSLKYKLFFSERKL